MYSSRPCPAPIHLYLCCSGCLRQDERVSPEELDPLTAQLLAQLWEWAVAMFGAKPSASLWAAIDRRRSRKLSYQSFVQEMSQLGFKGRLKTVTRWREGFSRSAVASLGCTSSTWKTGCELVLPAPACTESRGHGPTFRRTRPDKRRPWAGGRGACVDLVGGEAWA